MKRIKYAKEPVLRMHRWVVNVGCHSKKDGGFWKSKFHYCMNKKEVREICAEAPKGAIIEIHKSVHNFVEAWEK